jgi:CubicO group peptidase (beta-lactamase class C family)
MIATDLKTVLATVMFMGVLLANSNDAHSQVRFQEFPARRINSVQVNAPGTSPDNFIVDFMAGNHIPGLSACVVRNDSIIWRGAFGYADFAENRRVTDSTLFMLASVSKTVTGMALLQLWESGRFDLDENINDYLPTPIVNPHFPDSVITFRMLLTHTSSLNDNWNVMYSTYVQGDTPIPLDEYVASYFIPGGTYYDANQNFNAWAPGKAWEYCNHGFVLIGYLVQVISGMPFDQYCHDSIFVPAGMDESSWFLAGLDTSHVAMPYQYNGSTFVPYGHFGYADYPAGTLRSSAPQLARFLIAHLNFGELEGVRLLDSATVAATTTVQYPFLSGSQGLTWYRSNLDGHWAWQHGGGDQGVRTQIAFCPSAQSGAVVLTNGETDVTQILQYLLSWALHPNDQDADGVLDSADNCRSVANSSQNDIDNDGVGDACDNCVNVANSDQSDDNHDGIGDHCDGKLHVAESTLPSAHFNRPYLFRLSAFGGTPPYYWSFYGGDLPYGLTFQGDTLGIVQGIPTYRASFYFTLVCRDSDSPARVDTQSLSLTVIDPPFICGDASGDGVINVSDPVSLIAYVFSGGAPPIPYFSGDADSNGVVNISDAVYLIAYIFTGGTPPCPGC